MNFQHHLVSLKYLHHSHIWLQKQNVTFFPHRHQVVNEEGSREYKDEDEAYRDYQGSEEYQYHYDGDDYPSYEEDYSEEQVHLLGELPLLFQSGRVQALIWP